MSRLVIKIRFDGDIKTAMDILEAIKEAIGEEARITGVNIVACPHE